MSYSQLIVFRNGKAERDEEYRNSHGTASMVWTALLDRYYECVYPNAPFSAPRIHGISGGWEALWKAVADRKVPLRRWEWLVLQFTYDNALARGADVLALADALERFEDAHGKPSFVCHLAAIAGRLRVVGPCDAVGLYVTSVGDDPWLVSERRQPEEGEDPDEIEPDYRPYDLARDTKHWWVSTAALPAAEEERRDG